MRLTLPEQVSALIARLNQHGYEAYAVGGCVRDALMGRYPHDWDITTSAAPDEVAAVFPSCLFTGKKHGTVTVLCDGVPVEVTTFRTESGYTDHRRPDMVTFTASLQEDLARRDFTVNAMAYHPDTGIVDLFGGQEDLHHGIIRAVGDADTRFTEDALRILRALRFSACLGFEIAEDTAPAIRNRVTDLSFVAPERIWQEWTRLICGDHAVAVLRRFPEVAVQLFPPLDALIGFDQKSPHHTLDIWGHTLLALEGTPPTLPLRLAAFFHDIGKLETFTTDENGIGHFYRHNTTGARITEELLKQYRADRKTTEAVSFLILHHMDQLSNEPAAIRRALNRYGEENLRMLVGLIAADGMATVHRKAAIVRREEYLTALEQVLRERPCLQRSDLAINGHDLIAAGLKPGRKMGQMLDHLLELVLDGSLPNEKEMLLKKAAEWRCL